MAATAAKRCRRSTLFLGDFVLAKRLAPSLSSFSVTATSMTAAKSPIGHGRSHQRLESIQLFMKLGAGCELDRRLIGLADLNSYSSAERQHRTQSEEAPSDA
jgi:hypothetical protein